MRHLSPFNQRDMWNDFDRLFDSFLSPSSREAWDKLPAFNPRVDIKETDDYFLISTDLPGLTEADINIEVKDNVLTISGERKFEEEKKDDKFHRIERSYGKFSRSFQLPEQVDTDNIEARNEHGVFEVLVPRKKVEEKKTVKIASKAGGLFSKVFNKETKEKH
ncbi:MAG: Hsp20/alpha crystallin family protein [Bdellovibrionales bacterium]|nr:Hsp20/alpha crystallin family protein [Bdellovibrionales bacterium]